MADSVESPNNNPFRYELSTFIIPNSSTFIPYISHIQFCISTTSHSNLSSA